MSSILDDSGDDLCRQDTLTTDSPVTGYAHGSDDLDYGKLKVSQDGYYNLRVTGGHNVYLGDESIHGQGVWSKDWSSRTDNLYLYANHDYTVVVDGASEGDYQVTLAKAGETIADATETTTSVDQTETKVTIADEDSSDLRAKTIRTLYSQNTVKGHTDSASDSDKCELIVTESGYYDISCSGNTVAYVCGADGAGIWQPVTGSHTEHLYLERGQQYSALVYGNTAGETYEVSVTRNTAYFDGDMFDLTVDKTIAPDKGVFTATGHTDSVGDLDFTCFSITESGYYNINSSSSTVNAADSTQNIFIYDVDEDKNLSSSDGDWRNNLYVNASHTNYLVVFGYKSGEEYAVSLAPVGKSVDVNSFAYGSAAFYRGSSGAENTMDASGAACGVEINLFDGDTYQSVEKAIGSSFEDILRGDKQDNTLSGGAGFDQIWGGEGGNDVLAGGGDNDRYWFSQTDGNDTIVAAADNATDSVMLYNADTLPLPALRLNGNDLVISFGLDNSLTLENWRADKGGRIEKFEGLSAGICSISDDLQWVKIS